jgi:hypothetical protein
MLIITILFGPYKFSPCGSGPIWGFPLLGNHLKTLNSYSCTSTEGEEEREREKGEEIKEARIGREKKRREKWQGIAVKGSSTCDTMWATKGSSVTSSWNSNSDPTGSCATPTTPTTRTTP